MSSKKQSDSNQELLFGLVIFVGIILYKYQAEILQGVVTLTAILVGVGILFLYCHVIYRAWTRVPVEKSKLIHEMTVGELDGTDDECYEPRVQANPARQEEVEEVPKREVRIDRERLLSLGLYFFDEVSDEERYILERNGYEVVFGVAVGERKQSKFWMRTNRLESHEHTFLVQSLADKLRWFTTDVQINLTQFPDIVVKHEGKEYAFEIETPRRLSGKRDRLKEKAATNNKLYPGRWWFVPTRSAYAKTFRKYGQVVIRTELPLFLEGLFCPPPHIITGNNSATQGVTPPTMAPEKEG